jgi:Predicted membrane protein (DUF2306)
MMTPLSSGLRLLVRRSVRPHDLAVVTSTPHQLSPHRDRSNVRLWFSAAQRPSRGQSASAIATPPTQNAASIVAATDLASPRMTNMAHVDLAHLNLGHVAARRRLPPVIAVILALIVCLLVIPAALLAIALGLGLLQLPYELFVVLQRRPIAFPLHMVASGLALILIPIAAWARRRRDLHQAVGCAAAICVAAGGASALLVALASEATATACAGFFVQGVAWLALLAAALIAIRRGNVARHARLMIAMAAASSSMARFPPACHSIRSMRWRPGRVGWRHWPWQQSHRVRSSKLIGRGNEPRPKCLNA